MPRKPSAKGPKVTIYFSSVGGAIGRIEGYLKHIMDHKVGANVAYVKKGARKESMVTSYYSPFWLIAKGWGNPEAESMWDPATRQDKGGVVTTKSRHSATSSKWAEAFMRTVARKLDVWAFFRDRKLVRSAEGRKYTRTPDDKMENTMPDKFNALLEAIDGPPLDETKYMGHHGPSVSGLDSSEQEMFDEALMYAQQEGRFINKRDAKGAADHAIREFVKYKNQSMREDAPAVKKAIIAALKAEWKQSDKDAAYLRR
jgi:hypothetical protein